MCPNGPVVDDGEDLMNIADSLPITAGIQELFPAESETRAL